MTITKKTLQSVDNATRKPKTAYLVRVEGPRDPVTGARKWLTKQVRTMAEARTLERKWLREVDQGTSVSPKPTTVADLLTSWLGTKAGSVSPNSLKDYEIAIRRHLIPAFGPVKAQQLAPAQVQAQYGTWLAEHAAYQAWKATPDSERGTPPGSQGMSPRMVHRCHIVLSQALAQGVRFGILTRNVCSDVSKPKLGRGKPAVWNPGEWRAFLHAAKGDTMAPLWYFLAVEGMRRGEALGLRWQDVNWERGTVHISQTVAPDKSDRGRAVIQQGAKTNADARSVRLTGETIAVLKAHRDRQAFQRQAAGDSWQDHGLIVCTGTGTPINPNNVTRSYNRLVMLSGVPRIRVHDMRHTAATMLLRAGVSAKIVSERLGHATIAITLDTYSHVLPDMQDVAAEAMSALLGAQDRTA